MFFLELDILLLLTLCAHAREGRVVHFLPVCLSVSLSVCDNNIWELTPLQPLKYAPNGRRPCFIGFKCAEFLTNTAVLEKGKGEHKLSSETTEAMEGWRP